MDRRRPTEGPGLSDHEGKQSHDRVCGMHYLAAALVLLTASVILGLMAVPGREPAAKWKLVDSRGETVARNAVDFIEIEGLSREEADEMLRIFGWSVEPADPPRLSDGETFFPCVLCGMLAAVCAGKAASLLHRRAASGSEARGSDGRGKRLAELRSLYRAGLLSREEYKRRRKRLKGDET